MKKLLVICFVLSIVSNASSQDSLLYQPGPIDGKDTFLDGTVPYRNTGAATVFTAQTSGAIHVNALIKFNSLMYNLPRYARIDSAKLQLFVVQSSESRNVYCYPCTTAWDEGNQTSGPGVANWDTARVGVPWKTPGGDYITIGGDTAAYTANGYWKIFKVKKIIDSWRADTTRHHGFLIKLQSGTGSAYETWTSSDDNATPIQRPKLVVYYTDTSATRNNQYASFPDSFSLSAQTGQRDSSLGKIWNTGSWSDTVIVDSLRFKSTKNDTALPFFVNDSTIYAFPDYINRRIIAYSPDTLKFRVKFKPTVAGSYKDTLLVYYRIGSLSTYCRLDTILVKGNATVPPPQNRYAAFPDSFVFSAQVGSKDSSFGKIWNTGIWGDLVIVDSLRFRSTRNDTAVPFYIGDSLSRAYPDYINKYVHPYGDSLKFVVKFKPVSLGIFRDTVLIYYRFDTSSIYSRMDTMWVRGTATSPPPAGYDSLRVSIPDTFLVGPKKFPGDTIILPVYMNSIRYNNHNGIYSFQMVLVYNDSLFQCLGYDTLGTVLGNRGGLTEFTVKFRKDSGRGTSLDTLRIAGASDDSLYYPEVPGTPFAFPRPLIKLKFRIPTTAHNSDSTILRFTRFMFNEGIPVSSTDDGSIKLKLRKKGDVDKNGIIQPYDAVLVLRYVIHDTTLDAESQIAAEVSNNGEITAYDASLILQYFVGKITTFPAGSYYKQSLPSNRGAELALEWGSMQDGMVTVSVSAKNLAEVYGYSFELAYDPSVLTYLGHRSSDITKALTSVVKVENGVLRFASAGIEALNGNGALAQLTFRVSGNVNQDKIIQIVQAMLNEEIIIAQSSTVSKPNTYALEQNYPNPFNPDTRIRYQIPEVAQVQLVIYNLLGQRVRTLVNNTMPAGVYEVVWDGRNDQGINLASGVYIYRIKAGNFVSTRKLILMK